MSAGDQSESLSDAQRAGLDSRQVDQDRTLEAMHALEAALGSAAPGREEGWRRSVTEALALLESATTEEATNADRVDSLLSDIARTQPRLRTRVRGVRAQYRQLRETIGAVGRELAEHPESGQDFADVRQRLGWILTSLRHQRARESDLIYEAYYEAFHADLPTDADHP